MNREDVLHRLIDSAAGIQNITPDEAAGLHSAVSPPAEVPAPAPEPQPAPEPVPAAPAPPAPAPAAEPFGTESAPEVGV
jgi:hypothetical protein